MAFVNMLEAELALKCGELVHGEEFIVDSQPGKRWYIGDDRRIHRLVEEEEVAS